MPLDEEAGDDRSARARAGRDPVLAPGPADPPYLRRADDDGSDGQPQSSLVWVDTDGECVGQHLPRAPEGSQPTNPKVSLLVVDPDNTARFIQFRGDAELVTDGAHDHLDALTRKYTHHPGYYGHIYPLEQQARETRVIVRIHARRITLDAIHA